MFSIPQNHQGGEDKESDHPIIQMSEDADTLCILLRYVYPEVDGLVIEGQSSSFSTIRRGLELARKYQLDSFRRWLCQVLSSRVQEEPESVFALAWASELTDVVQAAARQTLSRPLLPPKDVSEFAHVPGIAILSLLQYRYECMVAVASIPKTPDWSESLFHSSVGCSQCDKSEVVGNAYRYVPRYCTDYYNAAYLALKERPHPDIISHVDFMVRATQTITGSCSICRPKAANILLLYIDRFVQEINSKLLTVRLFTLFTVFTVLSQDCIRLRLKHPFLKPLHPAFRLVSYL